MQFGDLGIHTAPIFGGLELHTGVCQGLKKTERIKERATHGGVRGLAGLDRGQSLGKAFTRAWADRRLAGVAVLV